MKIPVWWMYKTRGFWDHGMILKTIAGTLWPTCYDVEFVDYEQEEPPEVEGAICVLSARFKYDAVHEIKGWLDKFKWSVLIVASDEEGKFPWKQLVGPNRRIWVQTPHPKLHDEVDWKYVTGIRKDTQETVEKIGPRIRNYLWAYSGQKQNVMRLQCVLNLRERDEQKRDGHLQVTEGFGQGYAYDEYLKMLSEAKLAPCPPGSFTTDCFRIYESLECGTLPVATAHSPVNLADFDYWEYTLGIPRDQVPFPRLANWSDFGKLADDYACDDFKWIQDANLASAWWMNYKREFAYKLADGALGLMGQAQQTHGTPAISLKSVVTILIPSSPIPSHPSTALLEDTIKRLRAYPELKSAEIILMLDGVRDEQKHREADYEEYRRRVLELCRYADDFRGVLPMVFKTHQHQANMTKQALELVRTPLVMYVEHDTYPVGEIPWDDLFKLVLNREDVHYCRLNIFDRILDEHKYLMYDDQPVTLSGVPVVRTKQWSQRPHVAKKSLYDWFLNKWFTNGARTMIEDPLYSIALEFPEKFGMCIYTPEGSQLRSGHTNGREGEPKFEMERIR